MSLCDVDERLLEQLVAAAVGDASAADVTPPLTDGDDWTEPRRAWLRQFHRTRRAGLDAAAGEATWAVVVDGAVVGSVRLARMGQPGRFETGLWLTRSARDRGLGTIVLRLVLARAEKAGATSVLATTTPGNRAALALLRRAGFDVGPPVGDSRLVHARFDVDRSATTPEALLGEWRLRRRLVDRVAGSHGSVTGVLTLATNGADVAWRESGVLRWHGSDVHVSRRYLLRETDDGWWVHFDDGRPFHPWTPGSVVEHPCRADVYRGLIRVEGPDRWSVLWDVVGPAKSQRIVTRLRR